MFKVLKNRKFLLFLGIILIAAFLICRNFVVSPDKKINTAKVKYGILQESLTISGAIDADEQVTLRFQTSGRLSWVGVKEGDYVKKYQSIASLDQREVQKNLQKDLNDYLSARWDFDQASKDTYKDQVITDPIRRIIDKDQFDLNKSVLDVEIQNLSIEYANLWTPIEGIVTRVESPFAGVNTTPSQAEFDIVNPRTVYFSATADQTDVVKLTQNMPGELTLDSYPDTTISGTIKTISLIPDTSQTGTVYKVKFVFPAANTDYKYRLGMTGDLTFNTKEKNNVLYVPTKFLTDQNGKKYVTVKRNGKDQKVQVTTGMETDTDTEIISGLSAGETIYD